VARFWQGQIGEAILLFIVPTNFGFTIIGEMIDELFSFKETGSQLGEHRFHPELQAFSTVAIVVLSADEESWETIEY